MLSPEDVDWADSCLSKDLEMLDSGWNSLKDALLETLNDQDNPSPYVRDDSTKRAKTQIFSKVDIDGRNLVKTAINNITSTSVEAESKSDDRLSHEEDNSDDLWPNHKMEDIFLPTYNENSRDLGVSDPEVDFTFQAVEMEQSTQDIFKIWDLDIPPEEDDDLTKQLSKALAENENSSLDPTISTVSDGDSKAWKELKDAESIDDLVSGLADLALTPNSR